MLRHEAKLARAVYGTSVFHYDHVLNAMSRVAKSVSLVRRLEFPSGLVGDFRVLKFPSRVLNTIERRARPTSSYAQVMRGIGPGQFVPAIYSRLGRMPDRAVFRWALASQARRVARAARDADLLQFVDGTGFKALRADSARLTVAERRGLHYSTFSDLPDPIGGIPTKPPIIHLTPDYFDEELEGASLILVYSTAAKRSYIEQGYSEERIAVCPLPVSTQLPPLRETRDPDSFLFVGRCDVLKGLDVAVAAVEHLPKSARLRVAGPAAQDVIEWMSKHPRVEYLGVRNRLELRSLYGTSCALVLPSRESFALVAVEAAYYGLPVICKDDTGAAEFLPTGSCTIVNGRNPVEWANELELAHDNCRSGSYSSSSGAVADSLSPDAVAMRLAEIYFKLVERGSFPADERR